MTGKTKDVETNFTYGPEILIEKAAKAEKSDDALKFSQAALNAANALNAVALLGERLTALHAAKPESGPERPRVRKLA